MGMRNFVLGQTGSLVYNFWRIRDNHSLEAFRAAVRPEDNETNQKERLGL
jgi:hypothetical protein